MKKIGVNIWVCETGFTLFGAEFGNRMTVIRLSEGGLLLHSPVKISPGVVEQVKSVGAVSHIVTPNNFHGLFVDEWLSEFPNAQYYSAKNLTNKGEPGLPISLLHENGVGDEIKVVKIEGAPKVNEYAFVHAQSNTLILTDMAFNIGSDVSWWTKVFFKFNGAFDSFGPTRLMKSMISDPSALLLSIDEILDFDIDRVVVSHGNLLESKAKETMRQAFNECCSSQSSYKPSKLSLSRCG